MKFYSAEEIRASIHARELRGALKNYLKAPHRNSPRLVLPLSEGNAIGAMLAHSDALLGGKMVCVFPKSSSSGMDPHQGLVILFSPQDGTPLAAFDAASITGLRTAALSAAVTETVSSPSAETLTIFGTGLQAYLHAHLIADVRPIRQIFIVGRDASKSASLCERLAKELEVSCVPSTKSQALELPGIICLCTSATESYLHENEIPLGSHVNAIGACRPGMREIQLRHDTKMKVFVDDLERIQEESSELQELISENGEINLLSQLFSKEAAGKNDPQVSTLFKSVGTGLQDIVTASLVMGKGEKRHAFS